MDLSAGDIQPDTLARNWLRFGHVLRGLGFEAGPGRMLPFLRALTILDLSRADDLKTTVHAHFARRREDIALLDRALRAFLMQPEPVRDSSIMTAAAQRDPGLQLSVLEGDGIDSILGQAAVATYSRREALRQKDFDTMSEEEMSEVRRLIRLMAVPAGSRRSRRFEPGGDDRLDLRRLLRTSLRAGGEPLDFSWRKPRVKPRPLVVLCDISGSMERYTRVLLNFAYAVQNASQRVEAFVFATRLTRITRLLRSHDPDAALTRVSRVVEDWSGGTRIGEAINTFNRRYARRVLGRGAVVVLISDGWDRGDPAQLSLAVARLQRSCHRLIWMNPLLGAPGYEPLTLGLRAALPYVDDFLPAHNLESLEQLGRLLLQTQNRRPVRRQFQLPA